MGENSKTELLQNVVLGKGEALEKANDIEQGETT